MSRIRIDIELECLATWKEGSTHNLVARKHKSWKMTDEDSYRCFIYFKTSNNTWTMGESADAACTGFLDITEAGRVFNFTQSKFIKKESCINFTWMLN